MFSTTYKDENVLSNIVKYGQTTHMKGRYIGESIHLISDILEDTENKKTHKELEAYFTDKC